MTVHEQKKRDMLREWSTMGVPEQFLCALEKEYVGTSWCVATLPAGYPTTNDARGNELSCEACLDEARATSVATILGLGEADGPQLVT